MYFWCNNVSKFSPFSEELQTGSYNETRQTIEFNLIQYYYLHVYKQKWNESIKNARRYFTVT